MTAEQIVDNPVPRRRFRGDLQGYTVDRVQQRFLSRSPIRVAGPRSVVFDFS